MVSGKIVLLLRRLLNKIVYIRIKVDENEWVRASGVVTWEHFSEELSECFRWVLGSCLNAVSSAVYLNK